MWGFKLTLVLLLLWSIVSSCNRDKDVYANIMQMKSKPVTLSCDSMRLISYKTRVDTFPKQFYWVVYSDSVDCSSCRLTNLVHWNDLIYEIKESTNSVGFRFIFSPLKKGYWIFYVRCRKFKIFRLRFIWIVQIYLNTKISIYQVMCYFIHFCLMRI